MIGLDTNVLIRFFVRDDEAQFERAQRLIRREAARGDPVFLSHLVLMETEWVLRSNYRRTKQEIIDTFSGLLSAGDLRIEAESILEEALYLWGNSTAQFADCLVNAHHRANGCTATATFDARAAKLPASSIP